jgi:hypothetical protein
MRMVADSFASAAPWSGHAIKVGEAHAGRRHRPSDKLATVLSLQLV